jgi:8-oxo-dGTP diphosphatase
MEAAPANGHPRHLCPRCGWVDYHNPSPAASAIIVRDGRVLLSKRARDPKAGEWDLPGGFLEAGESGADGIAREIGEETGLKVTRAEVLDVLPGDYDGQPTLTLLYLIEATGEPVADDDSEELRWFTPDEVPWPLAWPHEEAVLRRVLDGRAAGPPRLG